MKYYQIKQLSRITSTTVRTLQYYDEIGLLKPAKRSDSGYRLYSEENLLLLQQISTLKFLGLSLIDIKRIMNSPEFDILKSLMIQANTLSKKADRIREAAKLCQYIAAQIEANQKVNWESTAVIIDVLEMNKMNTEIKQQYNNQAQGSELGRSTPYDSEYNPKRLYPIPRAGKRLEIGIDSDVAPFYGFDCWTHYEVSWLNMRGKPEVAIALIVYDAKSPMIVESKSLKLYFNSLNQAKFANAKMVEQCVSQDLEKILGAAVQVKIQRLSDIQAANITPAFAGVCLDNLDVACDRYQVYPDYLVTGDQIVTEILYSDILKSNCLVTNQPDWGSVQITYTGKQIDKEGLLKYIVSFRNHNEFHEQCIERIYMDIMSRCEPSELIVYGRYTRRGGLDINPLRASMPITMDELNLRLIRQ